MLFDAVKAIIGILALMAGWLIVQAYIRRRMGWNATHDVLEEMTHDCGCCSHSESCSAAPQDQRDVH